MCLHLLVELCWFIPTENGAPSVKPAISRPVSSSEPPVGLVPGCPVRSICCCLTCVWAWCPSSGCSMLPPGAVHWGRLPPALGIHFREESFVLPQIILSHSMHLTEGFVPSVSIWLLSGLWGAVFYRALPTRFIVMKIFLLYHLINCPIFFSSELSSF